MFIEPTGVLSRKRVEGPLLWALRESSRGESVRRAMFSKHLRVEHKAPDTERNSLLEAAKSDEMK